MQLPTHKDCAGKLRVLSDPTRLEVMRLLGTKPLFVKQLVATLEIEQSLLSHHLKVLRDAGLVRSETEGQTRRYHIVAANAHRDRLDLGCCELTFRRTAPRA